MKEKRLGPVDPHPSTYLIWNLFFPDKYPSLREKFSTYYFIQKPIVYEN